MYLPNKFNLVNALWEFFTNPELGIYCYKWQSFFVFNTEPILPFNFIAHIHSSHINANIYKSKNRMPQSDTL